MADLYTSQVHLKRLLSGQSTPAFTPASEAVLKMLDPDFFPGMGALNEDEHGRLQCPVRGCGKWKASLGQHLGLAHKAVGGAAAIRRALDIPKTCCLTSQRQRDRRSGMRTDAQRSHVQHASRSMRARHHRGTTRPVSMMARNAADTCPAQLAVKIEALRGKLGRSPSWVEFEYEYGGRAIRWVKRVFGTWVNAKAMCGLSRLPHAPVQRSLVVESLRAWIVAHGRLPSAYDAQQGDRAPMIPGYTVIMNAFGVNNWNAAMVSAAAEIGVRYAPPTRSRRSA